MSNCNSGQVDFNEFRQIAWQAGNVEFGYKMMDGAAGLFYGRRNVCINEMQRYFDMDFLVGVNNLPAWLAVYYS